MKQKQRRSGRMELRGPQMGLASDEAAQEFRRMLELLLVKDPPPFLDDGDSCTLTLTLVCDSKLPPYDRILPHRPPR